MKKGTHTFNYKEFDFEIEYNYSPEEPQTWDYPGCSEEWEIYNPTLNGVDASELLESQWDEFYESAIENLRSYGN